MSFCPDSLSCSPQWKQQATALGVSIPDFLAMLRFQSRQLMCSSE